MLRRYKSKSDFIIILLISIFTTIYEGICFLLLDPFPTPFSSTDWYLNHGGVVVWGWIFIFSGILTVVGHFKKMDVRYRSLFMLPQNMILQLTMFTMIYKIILTGNGRIILGAAYIIPVTIAHSFAALKGSEQWSWMQIKSFFSWQ